MYFLLSAVIRRFTYLGAGLGIVLMFIGAKMLASNYYTIPIGWSHNCCRDSVASVIFFSLLSAGKNQESAVNCQLDPP
jgi:predicted tellurium resistance membrane protein TerC